MESSSSLLAEYTETGSPISEWKEYPSDKQEVSWRRTRLPGPLVLLSLIANIVLVVVLVLQVHTAKDSPGRSCSNGQLDHGLPQVLQQKASDQDSVSDFAGLRRNIPMQWTANAASTEDEWEDTWNSTLMYPGIISLPDAYAREKGIPRSQRWPWDTVRGIYVINAYHNLHCVLSIKQHLEETRAGQESKIPWGHVRHCLLVLRDKIMCNADDTPRYTGFQDWGKSGYGQVRMCRDWSQLEQWALDPQQEGCWRPVPGTWGDGEADPSNHLLERYRFCSDLNPYKEKAETMWTDPADWEDQEDSAT